MTIKIQHKRSAVKGKAPLPTDLEYGEIAVNYEAGDPAFYIKDSANVIRRIGSQPGALVFKGSLAPTAPAPTAPATGHVYVMSADGVMAASWIGVAGRAVVKSENIAWDGTEWESLGDAKVPDATTAVKGIVQLADAAAITAGTAGRVVDAAQLRAHDVHVGETPPASPAQGRQWFRSSTGKLYVYYDDGAGAAQWVVANPQEAVDYSKAVMKAGDTMTGNLVLPTVNGGVPDRLNRAGNILQVVNATYSTQTSSSSSTFADTGLTATITPTSASSKILVLVNQAGCGKNTGNTGSNLRLLRGGTPLISFEAEGAYTGTATQNSVGSCSACYVDSPATTSATTYKTQFTSGSNIAVTVVQASGSTSTITLIEVAA